jgi:hypothetical protein
MSAENMPPSKGSQQSTPAPDATSMMREMHPDLFSDSEVLTRPQLAQQLFEFHLETLTNRNQETEFAYFCRRLAEKEICPNLRPQTGPTGGGDSKADSETIPISSELSSVWVGTDPKAASERWAFAFSAMKDWKRKARSDIEGIAGTNRGYTRIYYITNQYARDRNRAELEDDLKTTHGVDIHILDRTWITTAIFEHDRVDLAIEALHISDVALKPERKVGPRDLERETELAELDRDIADPERYRGAEYQKVEDCLRAALLARGLEKPRTDVEGYFARAARLAEEVGHQQQRLRVAYNYAWTGLWWYNDDNLLNSTYSGVEALARGSAQASDLEMLQNLWQLLVARVRYGHVTAEISQLASRTQTLKGELDRLCAETHRPNNALQARTNRLLVALNDAIEVGDVAAVEKVWSDFGQVVEDSKRLGDYPFEKFAKLLENMGDFDFGGNGFDALFEKVLSELEARRSDSAGGEMLLKRGFQKLEADEPYEAIRYFGRAQERFIKREDRQELISALMGASIAYEQAGLLWAARNNALAAAERCVAHYWEDGQFVRPTVPCLLKLIWLELQLGRISHTIEAMTLLDVFAQQLRIDEQRLQRFDDERRAQDGILGIHFLNATLDQLRTMELLPDVLETRGLFLPKAALLYALGHKNELRNEGFTVEHFPDDEIDRFMQLWANQPGQGQIPDKPITPAGQTVRFTTNLLGCEISVDVANNKTSIHLAEALLGAAEAFLSTSLDEGIAPYRADARMVIAPSESVASAPEVIESTIDGEAVLMLRHAPTFPVQDEANRMVYREALQLAVLRLIAHIAIISDPDEYFEQIAGEERAFARALTFSEIALTTANIFGDENDLSVEHLVKDCGAKRYELLRTEEWKQKKSKERHVKRDRPPPGFGDGGPPKELLEELKNIRHSERRIFSLIDLPLWDKAKWRATLYAQDWSQSPPVILGLGFRDVEAGRDIFAGWQKKLGPRDKDNLLRVCIVTGISRANPAAYSVVIGTNLKFSGDDRFAISVSRINRMDAQSSTNLDRFLRGFQRIGAYSIIPVHFADANVTPALEYDLSILKTSLVVRPAWEIGPNDPDMMGINEDDDPIIPEAHINDAPVLKVLEHKRQKEKKR